MTQRQRLLSFAAVTLAALFLIVALVYIWLYAVPFLLHEQYLTSYYVARSVQQGTFQLDDLNRPFLEHQLVLAHMVTALLARYSRWNLRLENAVGVALLLVSYALSSPSGKRKTSFSIG
jgi:hypothetical protein